MSCSYPAKWRKNTTELPLWKGQLSLLCFSRPVILGPWSTTSKKFWEVRMHAVLLSSRNGICHLANLQRFFFPITLKTCFQLHSTVTICMFQFLSLLWGFFVPLKYIYRMLNLWKYLYVCAYLGAHIWVCRFFLWAIVRAGFSGLILIVLRRPLLSVVF